MSAAYQIPTTGEPIGVRIRRARLEAGYTTRGAAKRCGFSRQGLCHWESGRCEPRAAGIRAICLGFGVTSDWLLGL
jgi:transcriptional regulator with XRE-family HTH domain